MDYFNSQELESADLEFKYFEVCVIFFASRIKIFGVKDNLFTQQPGELVSSPTFTNTAKQKQNPRAYISQRVIL